MDAASERYSYNPILRWNPRVEDYFIKAYGSLHFAQISKALTSHGEEGDLVAVSVAVEQPVPDGGWELGITRGTVLQGLQTDPYYFELNGLYIGQGTTMLSRAGIFCASQGIAVDMNNQVFKLPLFDDVLEGEIFLRNLPSIVTTHALGFEISSVENYYEALFTCSGNWKLGTEEHYGGFY
ncbi:uncharacterized protein LOC111306257 isoform X1 [Durio zibethinus]|uniref:Uncharacterized protein LOC111306257 isoform X1 n=1 Tax=Durio zibethinus TaxID=66656 RepID=A0A6P6A568_DURZI|nr:uncharacterized protein LOC111306257 isoform X1 [Durio zibethinus]